MAFDPIRARVYSTHTFWQDLKNWKDGVSTMMSTIHDQLQKIRAEIAVSIKIP